MANARKWENEIKILAYDFHVDEKLIFKYVKENAKGNENESKLYEMAHKKLMKLAFGS